MLFRSVSQSRYDRHIDFISSGFSVKIIPCMCIRSVFLCPSSVISQCFTDFLCFFLQRSKNLLTASVAISFSSDSCMSSFFASFVSDFKLSSEKVSVTNCPDLSILISSFSLTCHCLAFCFLHSMHWPHPIGTNSTLLSETGGMIPPFFFVWFLLRVLY